MRLSDDEDLIDRFDLDFPNGISHLDIPTSPIHSGSLTPSPLPSVTVTTTSLTTPTLNGTTLPAVILTATSVTAPTLSAATHPGAVLPAATMTATTQYPITLPATASHPATHSLLSPNAPVTRASHDLTNSRATPEVISDSPEKLRKTNFLIPTAAVSSRMTKERAAARFDSGIAPSSKGSQPSSRVRSTSSSSMTAPRSRIDYPADDQIPAASAPLTVDSSMILNSFSVPSENTPRNSEFTVLDNAKYPIPGVLLDRISEKEKVLVSEIANLRVGVSTADWTHLLTILQYLEVNASPTKVDKAFLITFFNINEYSHYSNHELLFLVLCILFAPRELSGTLMFSRGSERKSKSITNTLKNKFKFSA